MLAMAPSSWVLPSRTRSPLLTFLLLLFALSGAPSDRPNHEVSALRTVHQFTLASEAEEAELRAILAEFNAWFESEGLPAGTYRLWRSSADGEAPRYHWESVWPDQSSYDDVHGRSAYRRLVQRHMSSLAALLQDHTYARFQEVSVP